MGELFGFDFISNQGMNRVELKESELSNNLLVDGDLLFGRRSLIESGAGKCSLVISPGDDLTFESSIIRVRLNKEIVNPRYFFYYFKSPQGRGRVGSIVSGTNVKGIRGSDLKKLSIPIPPKEYQDTTVDILSAYDDLIENNNRQIQLLEQAARQLYNEWFVRLRFPGHEQVKVVNGVPEGWVRTHVPDIIDVNPKMQVIKNTLISYVPMSSLSENRMTIDQSDLEKRVNHTSVKFQNNDTLLAHITPCLENGKTGFVNFLAENEVACGSTEFIVLRGRKVSSYFAYCLARTRDFRENAIKSMIGSSGRQRVQTSCFNEFMVPLPPVSLLNEFDDFAQTCFDQIKVLSQQIEKLRQARDLLLPRLMNGEIRV